MNTSMATTKMATTTRQPNPRKRLLAERGCCGSAWLRRFTDAAAHYRNPTYEQVWELLATV
jgi:hypothetical protein